MTAVQETDQGQKAGIKRKFSLERARRRVSPKTHTAGAGLSRAGGSKHVGHLV